MAFFINDLQRQVLPQVIEALHQLEDHPELLDRDRIRRYSDSPPPYQSGETTQPPSPGTPVLSEADRVIKRKMEHYHRREDAFQSTPYEQFRSQVMRERDRLVRQSSQESWGRRQTLPYDFHLDFLANAENNVRNRWVEQGVWKSKWGPSWPKGTRAEGVWPMSGGPWPSGGWGHEAEAEPRPKAQRIPEHNVFGGWGLGSLEPVQETSVTEEPLAASECDTPASRPYHQFLYQLSKEVEWIKDELQSKVSTGPVDFDAKAYESIKDFWIKEKIWNPTCGALPGMIWMHEEFDKEGAEAPNNAEAPNGVEAPNNVEAPNDVEAPNAVEAPSSTAAEPAVEQAPDAIAKSGERSSSSTYQTTFGLAPTGHLIRDETDRNIIPLVPGRAEGSDGESARPMGKKRKESPVHLPTATISTRAPEGPAGRVLRSAHSSKVEKRRKSSSHAPKPRLRKQGSRSTEFTGRTKSRRQDRTLLEPQSDDANPAPAVPPTHPRKATSKASNITSSPLRRSSRIAAMNAKCGGAASSLVHVPPPAQNDSTPRQRLTKQSRRTDASNSATSPKLQRVTKSSTTKSSARTGPRVRSSCRVKLG